MPLYRISDNEIVSVERTTYEKLGLRECRLLIVSPSEGHHQERQTNVGVE